MGPLPYLPHCKAGPPVGCNSMPVDQEFHKLQREVLAEALQTGNSNQYLENTYSYEDELLVLPGWKGSHVVSLSPCAGWFSQGREP